LIEPFVEFAFMRRALVACTALAVGAGPVGAFLVLRRLSLMGDALAHAALPGAGAAYLLVGYSVPAIAAGGLTAGLIVVLFAGFLARRSGGPEESALAGTFLIALAMGLLLFGLSGRSFETLHLLQGSLLAVEPDALLLMGGAASVTLVVIALAYRPLVAEALDPAYLESIGARRHRWHGLFMGLVVLNIVAAFQVLGTLLALGLMLLPALAARPFARSVPGLIALSCTTALVVAFLGLLSSFHFDLPSGPAIVLVAGLAYLLSSLAAAGRGANTSA
jgi:zinc/manganese transport system permease protein